MRQRLIELAQRLFKRTTPEQAQVNAELSSVIPMPAPAIETYVPPKPPPETLPLVGTRQQLEAECGRLGHRTARASGAIEPDDAVMKSVEAKAVAMATAWHRPPSEVRDQRRIAQLTVLDETRKRQVIERDRAAIEYLTAREGYRSLGQLPSCPDIAPVFICAVIVGLIVSISPTFFDLLPGLDAFFRWIAASICALGVALLIVYGILPALPDEPQPAQRHRGTFFAALTLGVALLLIRLTQAATFQDLLLGIGLTLAEFSAVWMLERRAADVDAKTPLYLAALRDRAQTEHQLGVKKDELDRRQRALDRTETAITTIEAEIEHDHELGDLKALTGIAQNAARAGYIEGIAENAAWLGGVRRKEDAA